MSSFTHLVFSVHVTWVTKASLFHRILTDMITNCNNILGLNKIPSLVIKSCLLCVIESRTEQSIKLTYDGECDARYQCQQLMSIKWFQFHILLLIHKCVIYWFGISFIANNLIIYRPLEILVMSLRKYNEKLSETTLLPKSRDKPNLCWKRKFYYSPFLLFPS